MAEIIFGMAVVIFLFFIVWVICCCWWLNDKETLAERIVYYTRQLGRMRWFVIYAVLVFSLWGGAMIKVLISGLDKKECPKIECPECSQCPQIKTYEQEYLKLQDKVNNFCKEHKRAGICR